MKIYYVGRIKNKGELEDISFNIPNFAMELVSDISLKVVRSGICYSARHTKDGSEVNGKKKVFCKALGGGGNGAYILTDTCISYGELEEISTLFVSYRYPISDLREKMSFEDFSSSFLKRLVDLPENADTSTLAILSPLRVKLQQETNSEKRSAANIMIKAMEEILLSRLERKATNEEVIQTFTQAISAAAPVLERQTGWKKAIDAVANVIFSCFCSQRTEKNQGKSNYHSLFFANPNPVAKELEGVQKTISAKLEL